MFEKIGDCGFRTLYHQLLLLIEDDNCLLAAKTRFPHEEGDNALVLYGYADPEMGMSFEVFCMAWYGENEGFKMRRAPKSVSFKLRYEAVRGKLAVIGNTDVLTGFLPRIMEINKLYRAPEDVEQFREIWMIDSLRHQVFPDDIMVALPPDEPEGDPEFIWAHLAGIDEHYTIVRLLNEPYRDCGCHRGDLVKIRYLARGDDVLAVVSEPSISGGVL